MNPDDPTSQVVTPPRPDWDHMVRYWRALDDPTQNYSPTRRVGVPNTFYLARTVVADPMNVSDTWNEWNQTWADTVNADPKQAGINWAPLSRIVHSGYDWPTPGKRDSSGNAIYGARSNTSQPGYPYLYATWNFANDSAKLNRFYRDHVRPLTPNSEDYDVTALSFEPLVVGGEWLTPSSDNSVYLARYPLWRMGVKFTSWTALQGNDLLVKRITDESALHGWQPRDPFLLIYRWKVDTSNPNGGYYDLQNPLGIGAFDSRSRTLKILNPDESQKNWFLYDTYNYPTRVPPPVPSPVPYTPVALDVDWTNGALRYDFPPVQEDSTGAHLPTAEKAITVNVSAKPPPSGWPPTQPKVYDYPLAVWDKRTAGSDLTQFLLPSTLTVKVADVKGTPRFPLMPVNRTPRDYSNEYQVGLDPTVDGSYQAPPASNQPAYGNIRLPAHLSFVGNATVLDTTSQTFLVYYRWRDNGIVPAGKTLDKEKPDLVCAYYRTGAIVDIRLTVTRADASRTTERISQTATVTRRVKLRTALRDVRQVR